jgi:hypothetical protein
MFPLIDQHPSFVEVKAYFSSAPRMIAVEPHPSCKDVKGWYNPACPNVVWLDQNYLAGILKNLSYYALHDSDKARLVGLIVLTTLCHECLHGLYHEQLTAILPPDAAPATAGRPFSVEEELLCRLSVTEIAHQISLIGGLAFREMTEHYVAYSVKDPFLDSEITNQRKVSDAAVARSLLSVAEGYTANNFLKPPGPEHKDREAITSPEIRKILIDFFDERIAAAQLTLNEEGIGRKACSLRCALAFLNSRPGSPKPAAYDTDRLLFGAYAILTENLSLPASLRLRSEEFAPHFRFGAEEAFGALEKNPDTWDWGEFVARYATNESYRIAAFHALERCSSTGPTQSCMTKMLEAAVPYNLRGILAKAYGERLDKEALDPHVCIYDTISTMKAIGHIPTDEKTARAIFDIVVPDRTDKGLKIGQLRHHVEFCRGLARAHNFEEYAKSRMRSLVDSIISQGFSQAYQAASQAEILMKLQSAIGDDLMAIERYIGEGFLGIMQAEISFDVLSHATCLLDLVPAIKPRILELLQRQKTVIGSKVSASPSSENTQLLLSRINRVLEQAQEK